MKVSSRFLAIFFIALVLCLQSCDTTGYDYLTVENKLPYSIKISGESESDLFLQPNESVEFEYGGEIGHISPFDNGETNLLYACTRGTIYFNDTVYITYQIGDVFEKNMRLIECWTVVEEKRGSHFATYSIDEQDYQNALLQCGYRK
ncbi:MAG: hypothetical protein IJ057_02080 [Bacteroidales bacterium]|nr:hypothetical protein [Bacteroidales bacterium]